MKFSYIYTPYFLVEKYHFCPMVSFVFKCCFRIFPVFFFSKNKFDETKKNHGPWNSPRSRLLPFSRPMTCQNVSQVAGAEAPVLTKKFLVGQKNVESQGGKLSMILNVWVFLTYIWVFPKIGGTAKLSSLIGFSIVNHRFWGTPIFGNTHLGSFG